MQVQMSHFIVPTKFQFQKLLIHKMASLTCRRTAVTIIDGRKIANEILKDLKLKVQDYVRTQHCTPHLTAILVGDDVPSQIYVRNKSRASSKCSIRTTVITLPNSISQDDLKDCIHKLNSDDSVHGILLQLPLPKHINTDIGNAIAPEKDVDGFTSLNLGKFYLNPENSFIPCTALAVHKILTSTKIETTGKNALVCGRSKHVGLPISMLLHSNFNNYGFNTNVTICHQHTPKDNLVEFCQKSDIIISATGVPDLIRGYMVKNGSVIIDVGIHRRINPETGVNEIVGDVNQKEAAEKASFITPVPGGVGPLTVAMVMKNVLKAANMQKERV